MGLLERHDRPDQEPRLAAREHVYRASARVVEQETQRVLVAGLAGERREEPAAGSVSAGKGASRETKIDSHEEAEAGRGDALYDEQRTGLREEGSRTIQAKYCENPASAAAEHRGLRAHQTSVPGENADDQEDDERVGRLEGHHVLVDEGHACSRFRITCVRRGAQ